MNKPAVITIKVPIKIISCIVSEKNMIRTAKKLGRKLKKNNLFISIFRKYHQITKLSLWKKKRELTKKKKAQYGAKASMAAGGKKYGSAKKGAKKSKKNWIQGVNASIKRRGTKGKCTPITKKGCTGRARALAKTFKKMAKKRKKKK